MFRIDKALVWVLHQRRFKCFLSREYFPSGFPGKLRSGLGTIGIDEEIHPDLVLGYGLKRRFNEGLVIFEKAFFVKEIWNRDGDYPRIIISRICWRKPSGVIFRENLFLDFLQTLLPKNFFSLHMFYRDEAGKGGVTAVI